jgi:hypothetical protein
MSLKAIYLGSSHTSAGLTSDQPREIPSPPASPIPYSPPSSFHFGSPSSFPFGSPSRFFSSRLLLSLLVDPKSRVSQIQPVSQDGENQLSHDMNDISLSCQPRPTLLSPNPKPTHVNSLTHSLTHSLTDSLKSASQSVGQSVSQSVSQSTRQS